MLFCPRNCCRWSMLEALHVPHSFSLETRAPSADMRCGSRRKLALGLAPGLLDSSMLDSTLDTSLDSSLSLDSSKAYASLFSVRLVS